MKFIVHDAAGNILRTGSCPVDHLALQARAGETAIEGEANDILDKIVAGVVVKNAKPAPPALILRPNAGEQLAVMMEVLEDLFPQFKNNPKLKALKDKMK